MIRSPSCPVSQAREGFSGESISPWPRFEEQKLEDCGANPRLGGSDAFVDGGQPKELAFLNATNSTLGLKRPFLDLFCKSVLQTEAPALERINEQEGCFLFPRNRMPGCAGAASLCQAPAPRQYEMDEFCSS